MPITPIFDPLTGYQPLASVLSSLASNGDAGLVAKDAGGAVVARTLTAPAAGISVSNSTGVSGNPTLALANDLAALEGLGSTGLAVRSASDTWLQRAVAAGTGVAVSNGDGVAGNPSVALSSGSIASLALADGSAQKASNLSDLANKSTARANLQVDQEIDFAWFGVVSDYSGTGTGGTDNATALANLATYMAANGGHYRILGKARTSAKISFTLATGKTLTIRGVDQESGLTWSADDGGFDITVYAQPNVYGPLVTFQNVRLNTTRQPGAGGTALVVTGTPVSGNPCPSAMFNTVEMRGTVETQGWGGGIKTVDLAQVQYPHCNFAGRYADNTAFGIWIGGVNSPTDHVVEKFHCQWADKAVKGTGTAEGIFVCHSHLIAVRYGFHAVTAGEPLHFVHDNHINAAEAAVYMENSWQSSVHDNHIYLFNYGNTSTVWRGVHIVGCDRTLVTGNIIEITPSLVATTYYGIHVYSGVDFAESGNSFAGRLGQTMTAAVVCEAGVGGVLGPDVFDAATIALDYVYTATDSIQLTRIKPNFADFIGPGAMEATIAGQTSADLRLKAPSTGQVAATLGYGRTGSGISLLDLIGDATGNKLRLLREAGANGDSKIEHYGTGALYLNAVGAAPVRIATTNTVRVEVTAAGLVAIGSGTPTEQAHVFGNLKVSGSANFGGSAALVASNIGSTVQAYSANLAQLAGLSLVADRLPYANGTGTLALATFTSFGRSLVDDASASDGRTTLGLGTSATVNTGTSGGTIPLLNGGNTWSATQNFGGHIGVGYAVSTADASLTVGEARSGSGYGFIDILGDATGKKLRLIRGNTGANTTSALEHDGTGDFLFNAVNAARQLWLTDNTVRMSLLPTTGYFGIGPGTPIYNAQVSISQNSNTRLDVTNTDAGTAATAMVSTTSDTAQAFMVSHASTRVATRWGFALGGWNEVRAGAGGLAVGTTTNTPLVLGANSVEVARLTSLGFGVGTIVPAKQFTVAKTANAAEGGVIAIQNVGVGVGTSVALYLAPNDGGGNDVARAASIKSRQTTSGNYADLGFFTANSDTPVERMTITASGNYGFGGQSFGGGSIVMFIANTSVGPSTNPSGGGILYVDAGALKYRGSSGTVTTIGPA